MGIGLDSSSLQKIAMEYSQSREMANTYLSLPLNGKPKTDAFWSQILEKMENRLSTWGSFNSYSSYFEQPSHLLPIHILGSQEKNQ